MKLTICVLTIIVQAEALRHSPGQRSESNERADIDRHDEPPICSGLQAPWTLAVQVVECLW